MFTHFRFIFCLFFCFLFFAIALRQELFADSDVIHIAAMLPLSGDYAMEGTAFLEGVRIAEEEINKSGGIHGKRLHVVIEDTAYDLKNSSTIAKRLVSSRKNIHGVIVSTLHEVKVAAPIFKSANMPTLVLWDAAPEIEKMGKNFFSIGPWAPDTGAKSSRFARLTLKKRRAVIIANHHDWSQTVSEVFKKDFENGGGEVLAFEVLNPETMDFRSTLLKIAGKKPDVIYAPLVFGIATFAKQLRQQGIAAPVVMSDNITEALIDSAQGALEGIYHTTVQDPSNEVAIQVRELYTNKYKKEPKLLLFNAWGYDGVKVFANVLQKSDTPEGIVQAMYKASLNGASGSINFNEYGTSPRMISVYQIKSGSPVLVEGDDQG